LVLTLGALNLLIGLYSVGSAFRYRRYARKAAPASKGIATTGRLPSVTLFVPCCGEEEGLEENLESLLVQDYPEFRARFIVESSADGAVPVIERLLERHSGRGGLVIAGAARGRSQKVHNLLAAIQDAPESEVLVFADSDGRPEPGWLKLLVPALDRAKVGVASTYRFYLPEPATFATLLRSVWNASVLTLLGDHHHNFAWGGSMAMRRDVFERIGVVDVWQNALSDDYAVTHAVRRAGLKVEFVPQCLVATGGRVGFIDLLSWSARQIAITRVYWPALFRVAAVTHLLFTTFLVLAPLAGFFRLWTAILVLAFWSGVVRAGAIADLAPQWRRGIQRHFWAYSLMVPLAAFLTMQGVLRALSSRRVEWRGKIYEMRSASETVILRS
ncbi:MAG: glycosyltransferase, partial [Vicinamibacteria bacterium]